MALVVILVVIFVDPQKDERDVRQKNTMPCGEIVPSDVELMGLTDEELDKFSKADINWLINYVGHKMSETLGQEYKDWGDLFTRLSAVKTKKGWHTEPYPVDY